MLTIFDSKDISNTMAKSEITKENTGLVLIKNWQRCKKGSVK